MAKSIRNKVQTMIRAVTPALESEIEYAMRLWEDNRDGVENSIYDNTKGIESWIAWAQIELTLAQQIGYRSFDKSEAVTHIRKAAGHLIRAMFYYNVKPRKLS